MFKVQEKLGTQYLAYPWLLGDAFGLPRKGEANPEAVGLRNLGIRPFGLLRAAAMT